MSNDCYLELGSGFPTFDNANTALDRGLVFHSFKMMIPS